VNITKLWRMYITMPADNRAYLATVLRTSAQLQPYGWTSNTLRTLSAMQEQEILG